MKKGTELTDELLKKCESLQNSLQALKKENKELAFRNSQFELLAKDHAKRPEKVFPDDRLKRQLKDKDKKIKALEQQVRAYQERAQRKKIKTEEVFIKYLGRKPNSQDAKYLPLMQHYQAQATKGEKELAEVRERAKAAEVKLQSYLRAEGQKLQSEAKVFYRDAGQSVTLVSLEMELGQTRQTNHKLEQQCSLLRESLQEKETEIVRLQRSHQQVVNEYYRSFNKGTIQHSERNANLISQLKQILTVESDQALLQAVDQLKKALVAARAISSIIQAVCKQLGCGPADILPRVVQLGESCTKAMIATSSANAVIDQKQALIGELLSVYGCLEHELAAQVLRDRERALEFELTLARQQEVASFAQANVIMGALERLGVSDEQRGLAELETLQRRVSSVTKFVAVVRSLLQIPEECMEEEVLLRVATLIEKMKLDSYCDLDLILRLERLLGVRPEHLCTKVMDLKHRCAASKK